MERLIDYEKGDVVIFQFPFSKGEKSNGVIGYEGNPPYLIIGAEHLNKSSNLYWNMNELQFIIASEFAHIYFKHSKITSQDVWRGVADKGSFLIGFVRS